jgi:hypothetical protein
MKTIILLAVVGLLCGTTGAVPVAITNVPHVRQLPDFCGEACVAMALNRLGFAYTQEDVFDASELDPLLGRGCYARELATAMSKIGFDPGAGWFNCTTKDLDRTVSQQWNALVTDLRSGVPSIVCTYFDERPATTQHFRLITGYDDATREVIYHDPALDDGANLRMPFEKFARLWPLRPNAKNRTLIRFACRPQRIAKPAATAGKLTAADYSQRMQELLRKTPALRDSFETLIEPPFIVIGDITPKEMKRQAEEAVRWSVGKLKKEYFAKDPDHVIAVWLFKDAESYTNNTLRLTGHAPTTIYGFYSSEERALIMNIRTGGGTLVHEIVHPFIRANFPDCPSWFNEGLASLYERCAEKDGCITGLTNWRLGGLKKAIMQARLPTFKELTATTDNEFYSSDRGDNYAQARYLCYYLQERGLLAKFYHAFVKNFDEDPTGYRTLTEILGEKDMADFQRRWEKYVNQLHYP